MVVRLSRAINNDIIEICKDGFPNEVCGVLIGKMEEDDFQISSFVACKNLNKERSVDRYELDPKDYINADRVAKEQSMDIIGIYHSHPNHPAIASDPDKALCDGPSALRLDQLEPFLEQMKAVDELVKSFETLDTA